MTTDKYLKALSSLGWKQSDLCRRIDVSKNTASRWGQEGAPAWVGEYLGALLAIDAIHRQFVRPTKPPVISAEEENAGELPTDTRAAERVKRMKKLAIVKVAT